MSPDIVLTDAASIYIKKMLEKKQGAGFRLSIKKTGCSGYSYMPEVIETVNTNDVVIETANGVMVYMDTTWLHLLLGLNIDYIEEEKSGLKQKRLVFTNPKESSRCGCGESFHVESD
jgi:iron-sulfur cluster assembly accessory protein